MVTITSIVLLAASSIASAVSVPLEARAAAVEEEILYAYGAIADARIGGVRLTYGNGTAFIGDQPPSDVSVATNITISWDSSSQPVSVSANSSNVNFTSSQYFFVNTDDDAFDSVQISDSAPSDSYTDTGFVFYGNWLFWKSDRGDLQSKFYATPSGEDGVWTLKWNSANTEDGISAPVSLRTIAPPENLKA